MATKSACRYDLNTVNGKSLTPLYNYTKTSENDIDVDALLNNNRLTKKGWFYKDNTYTIVRYNKKMLSNDIRATSGNFRSVIIKDGNVVCFAPPKSLLLNQFVEETSNDDISAEEFVEGTMINMFWSGEEWEIATRSSVGGKVAFFTSETTLNNKEKNTFRWMFLDAISHQEALAEEEDFFRCFENIPKNYCLSFVLQHPKNRIVVPFSSPNIYLVAAYSIDENVVSELNLNEICDKLPGFIKTPEKYTFTGLEDATNTFKLPDATYKTVGIMLKRPDGRRAKIRNPLYENVRILRGNQPKLQYRYLMLRQNQKVSEYLKYYPEHSKLFANYRKMVHDFTYRLHDNYISCYVKKKAPLNTYSAQYRTNMYKIHQIYINDLMPKSNVVTRSVVIEYVNTLPLQILMHAVNYHYRSMNNSENKAKLNRVSQDDNTSQDEMELDA